MRHFSRYVAIGDSTVEGLDDPHEEGGYRGWADRLAARIAAVEGKVSYANLGVRGRNTREIRNDQLAPAVALRPDLAAVVCGTNDLLGVHFDPVTLATDIEAMQRALIAAGATVITFTLPDLSAIMPLARLLRPRLLTMNDVIRDVSAATGAIVCDLAAHPVASDVRLWSDDRLHANSAGHERIAAALAWHLNLSDADNSWSEALPGNPPSGARHLFTSEIRWIRRHLMPWIWRHANGRSSGDGISAKYPEFVEIEAAQC